MKTIHNRSRQLEVTIYCAIAAFEFIYCTSNHNCNCGHLRHGSHEQYTPWIIDGIGLFALIAACVVSIRGRFPLSKITAIVCGLLVVLMFIERVPCGVVGSIFLIPISVFHFISHYRASGREETMVAEQGGASDR